MEGRLFRRFGRLFAPVVLGQRSMGFWVAAVLVFCWQGTRAVQAAILPQGSSEDDHFKLEWDYDLAAGTGTIWIHCLDDSQPGLGAANLMWFSKISLFTRGMTLDSIAATSQPNAWFAGPTNIGTQGGLDLYSYNHDFPNPYGSLSAVGCFLTNTGGSNPVITDTPAQIDVTFPTTGVRLYESSLEYSGVLSCAAGMLTLTDQEMPFVSVEVIPEPATIALLGLGGLAAASRRKKTKRL